MQLALQPGDTLDDKYAVDEMIGEGGMGVVFAAKHLELDTPVAIKVLRPDAPAVWAKRFLREARAASQIDCEHVARVFDVGRLGDGTPYMVLELLIGCDLEDLLEVEGPLEIATAATYGLQVCEALAAAHLRGVVHRDVKPANLFLTHRDDGSACIKLLDFGISKAATRAADTPGTLTRTGSFLGSPRFMSPEQLASSRDVDTRSDLWSLGASLFELLSGAHAFEGESVAELYSAILRDPPRRLRQLRPDIPEALDELIARCLDKDVDRRVQTAAELADGLRPFAAVDRRIGSSWMPGPMESERPAPSSLQVPPLLAPAPLRLDTLVLDAADAEREWDDDELDYTPPGSVQPVAVAAPALTPGPRGRLPHGGTLALGALVGAALAIALSWGGGKLTPLSSSLRIVVATPRVTASLAAQPEPTSTGLFVYSEQLDEGQRRQLEGDLDGMEADRSAGRWQRVTEKAKRVLAQLAALGIGPHRGASSIGAKAQLALARVQADKVKGLLDEPPRALQAAKSWASRMDLELAFARAAYEKVNPWGVRSLYRCGLLEMAELDRAVAAVLQDVEATTRPDREWVVSERRRHLKLARTALRHALQVQAETMLCVEEARRARDAVDAELASMAGP